MTDEQILERLVALNAERAEEEKRGLIRWLRPEFQAPQAAGGAKQTEFPLPATAAADAPTRKKSRATAPAPAAKAKKAPWPRERGGRTKAVQEALAAAATPLEAEAIARQFSRANVAQVAEILTALCSLGLARKSRGRYSRL